MGRIRMHWTGMLVAGGIMLCPGHGWGQELASVAEPESVEPDEKKPEKSEAEIAFEEGQQAFFKQDFENALKHFKLAAEMSKDDPNYLYFLGNTYLKMGKKEEARKEFEELLKKKPNHINGTVALADLLYEEQDWKQVATLLKGIVEFKHNYHIYHHLADAQYFLGDLREARKNYEEAIKLNAASAIDHYQLANIFLAQLKYSRAADEYNLAFDPGKNEAIVHYKLGMAYFNMRNYLGKIQKRKYLEAKPGQVLDEYFLIESTPGEKDFYYCAPRRSCVYHLKRAIDAGIDAPELLFAYANVFFHTRRYQQADQLYQTLEKVINKENQALFYYYFGQVKFRLKDFDGYIAHVRKAIELNKKVYGHTLVEAYQAVAGYYGKMEDLPRQIEYLKRCIDEEPSNASFHHALGDAYIKQKDSAKAVEQWKLVLEINPDHSDQMTLMNLINKHQPDNGKDKSGEQDKDQDKEETSNNETETPKDADQDTTAPKKPNGDEDDGDEDDGDKGSGETPQV